MNDLVFLYNPGDNDWGVITRDPPVFGTTILKDLRPIDLENPENVISDTNFESMWKMKTQ